MQGGLIWRPGMQNLPWLTTKLDLFTIAEARAHAAQTIATPKCL